MSNLIQQFGPEWFRSKFGGSFFRYKGLPARVVDVKRPRKDTIEVQIRACTKVNGKVVGSVFNVSPELFPDGKPFAVPELGYRSALDGRWLALVQRNNSSYTRGLAIKNMKVSEHLFTVALRREGVLREYMSEDDLNYIALNKEFIPFHRGIKLMLDKKLYCFAASPTVAVVPSQESDNLLSVLMCNKIIGAVDADGARTISAPVARTYVEETVCQLSPAS